MQAQKRSMSVVHALLSALCIETWALSESEMRRTVKSSTSSKSIYRKRNGLSVSAAASKRTATKRRNIRARSAK